MKRRICGVCVCVTIALMASYDAAAQSKKKGKEPELAISKLGKLIFEDDFSGKELEWIVPANCGAWAIKQRTLVTKSRGFANNAPSTYKSITALDNLVIHFRAMIPNNARFSVEVAEVPVAATPAGVIDSGKNTVSVSYWAGSAFRDYAIKPYGQSKPHWISVLYEALGNECALTVDGRAVTGKITAPEIPKKTMVRFRVAKDNEEPVAIDDVKVWEALPKDEETGKDKKKK